MLVHNVFFWLNEDLDCARIEAFREGLETLRGIEAAEAVYVGVPAPTQPRPVIDNSYTFGLTVLFKDMAGHDAYQVHPLHKAFLKEFASCWERVQIYDAL